MGRGKIKRKIRHTWRETSGLNTSKDNTQLRRKDIGEKVGHRLSRVLSEYEKNNITEAASHRWKLTTSLLRVVYIVSVYGPRLLLVIHAFGPIPLRVSQDIIFEGVENQNFLVSTRSVTWSLGIRFGK